MRARGSDLPSLCYIRAHVCILLLFLIICSFNKCICFLIILSHLIVLNHIVKLFILSYLASSVLIYCHKKTFKNLVDL